MLAERRGWTKTQVDAEDPDYIDEYLTYIAAKLEHDKEQKQAQSTQQSRSSRHNKYAGNHH